MERGNMAKQIALSWSEKCETELLSKGFVKEEVYIKYVNSGVTTKEQVEIGDADFFDMKHSPFQFVTTSWWGAMPD